MALNNFLQGADADGVAPPASTEGHRQGRKMTTLVW